MNRAFQNMLVHVLVVHVLCLYLCFCQTDLPFFKASCSRILPCYSYRGLFSSVYEHPSQLQLHVSLFVDTAVSGVEVGGPNN